MVGVAQYGMSNHSKQVHDAPERVTQWLRALGFEFNPFLFLESSQDPHLLRFLVIQEGLEPAWQDVSALIGAPVGGGKTALRHYATWASWRGHYSFFPVPYILPHLGDALPPVEVAAQARYLSQALARSILFHMSAFPQGFLGLPVSAQADLGSLLWQAYAELPLLMGRWRQASRATNSDAAWRVLVTSLVEPAQLGGYAPPPPRHLAEVARHLAGGQHHVSSVYDMTVLEKLLDTIQEVFPFGSVHFLVDGVDAFAEQVDEKGLSDHRQQWLVRWLEAFRDYFEPSVKVKVFLPSAMLSAIQRFPGSNPTLTEISEFSWHPVLLAEVIRRRLFVATNGRFDSLDAISDGAIVDLEMLLAKEVEPLPREILTIIQRVLIEHALNRPHDPLLRGEDIHAARSWYKTNIPHSRFRSLHSLAQWW